MGENKFSKMTKKVINGTKDYFFNTEAKNKIKEAREQEKQEFWAVFDREVDKLNPKDETMLVLSEMVENKYESCENINKAINLLIISGNKDKIFEWKNENGCNIIHIAVLSQNFNKVKDLVNIDKYMNDSKNLDSKTNEGNSSFVLACKNKNEKIAKFLIKRGADLEFNENSYPKAFMEIAKGKEKLSKHDAKFISFLNKCIKEKTEQEQKEDENE